ncbi:hypothetical protein PIB30_033944 [Stylosanthes scabra]|uniref:Uncharacterized protein n=1 Tax=Stylosanthes scabra TaxID=79078 RepID=A0ABU6ZC94_9FABA|nr:hypothetical protein [Stylosanthes scabra]
MDLGPLRSTKDIFTTADMGIVSIAGIAEDVIVKIGSLTVPADFHVIRSTRHSKGGTPQVLLGRPTLQTAGFKLDYITNAFSFKKKVKIRKQGEHNLKEEKEEEKEKRKLELKCKSVEDLIGKLYAFKRVLHHNDAMNHHLGQWRGHTLLVLRPHDLKLPKSIITGATARPHASLACAMALVCQRDELGHIRPKLHKCVARSRPLLGARAWSCVGTIAVARPCPSTWCSLTNYWKGCAPAPLWTRARPSPLKRVFGPPFKGAPAR